MGQQWVLVITIENATSPSVIGPFDKVDEAVRAGEIIDANWLTIKLAAINPLPPKFMKKLRASR